MAVSTLAKQTALRASAILFVKAIGFAGRIPLYRLLGTEGVGLYQIAYSFFGFVLAVCCGGLPTALALTVSRDRRLGIRLGFRLLALIAVIGVTAGAACCIYASELARLLGEPALSFALRCLSPAIGLVPVLMLVRGMMQGLEGHGLIAASEVIEQVVRMGTMLALAMLWIDYGVPSGVGGAVLGAFTGAGAALFFLTVMFGRREKLPLDSSRTGVVTYADFMVFLKLAMAIAATRLIIPLSDFLDSLIIPHRLQQSGLSASESVSIFGEVIGIAATIAYMPNVLSVAVSYTLSTRIARDWKEKNFAELAARSGRASKLVWMWGTGSGCFLFLYAGPLSDLLFHAPNAAQAIRLLSVIPLCAGLRELTTALLWGMQQKRSPINGLLLGVIMSLAASFYLTSFPGYAYLGASASIICLEGAAAVWNAAALRRTRLQIGRLSVILRETLIMISIVTVSYWICRQAVPSPEVHPVWSLVMMGITGACMCSYLLIRSGMIVMMIRK